MGVDVVREREDRLDIGRVPLHRDLDLAQLGGIAVRRALEVDDVLVGGLLRVVHVTDEVSDAPLGVELVPYVALALVDQRDPQPLGEKRRLAQPLHEDLARPLELVEDLEIR